MKAELDEEAETLQSLDSSQLNMSLVTTLQAKLKQRKAEAERMKAELDEEAETLQRLDSSQLNTSLVTTLQAKLKQRTRTYNVAATCYLAYCNNHNDLQKAFCRRGWCDKRFTGACQRHWRIDGSRQEHGPNPEECIANSNAVMIAKSSKCLSSGAQCVTKYCKGHRSKSFSNSSSIPAAFSHQGHQRILWFPGLSLQDPGWCRGLSTVLHGCCRILV